MSSNSTQQVPSSFEDLEKLFEETYAIYQKMQNMEYDYSETSVEYQDIITKAIRNGFSLAVGVQRVGLFSPNEKIHEVTTPSLKFLLIPHILAFFLLQRNIPFDPKTQPPLNDNQVKERRDFRKNNLQQAINQLTIFMDRCAKLDLMLDEDKKEFYNREETTKKSDEFEEMAGLPPLMAQFSMFFGGGASALKRREDKIRKLQRTKEMRQKILLLTKKKMDMKKAKEDVENTELEEIERDLFLSILQHSILDSLENISSIDRELHVINVLSSAQDKELSQNSKNNPFASFLANVQASQNMPPQPKVPIKVSDVDADNPQDILKNVENFNKPGGPNVLRITPQPTNIQKIRQDMFVNKNPWTESIEEFGDRQLEMLQEQERQKKQAEDIAKYKEQQNPKTNEDDEKKLDKKRKEKAEWDDWADAHPKGMGNMNK